MLCISTPPTLAGRLGVTTPLPILWSSIRITRAFSPSSWFVQLLRSHSFKMLFVHLSGDTCHFRQSYIDL